MLRIKNLWVKYATSEWILKDVNLHLEDGEFTIIGGKSGSGKTTLVRCLVGLFPTFYKGEVRGAIEISDKNPLNGPSEVFGTVGFVSQQPKYHTVALSVKDEIITPLENMGLPRDDIHSRLETVLRQVGIRELKEKPIPELSAGELQKVAIASALSIKPNVLVLDEPVARLDRTSSVQIAELLHGLTEEGVLVIICEHHLDEVLPYMDKLFRLEHGRLQRITNREELRAFLEEVDLPEISEAFLQLKKSHTIERIPVTIEEAKNLLREKGLLQ